jgi:hypothetical protein
LRGADLRGANLRGANLRGANLSNVTGFTTGELKQEAKTLERATMPDGQKYYGAAVFEPAFHFLVSQDWVYYEAATTPNTLYIEGRQGGQLLFANPRHVFDSSNASEQKEVPRPANADEWVSWFQSHPNLDTSEPVPMSVGGVSGVRIDVTPTSENESGVVLLFPVEDTQFGSYVGSKDRLVIVDVEGETVVINVAAPAGKFDEFLPKAQKVLDTVEWNGR